MESSVGGGLYTQDKVVGTRSGHAKLGSKGLIGFGSQPNCYATMLGSLGRSILGLWCQFIGASVKRKGLGGRGEAATAQNNHSIGQEHTT